MEKEQISAAISLTAEWKKLETLLLENRELDADQFKRTFRGSYTLLAPISCVDIIDKQIMQMIIHAYRFVNAYRSEHGNLYKAAVILTERMFHHCVVKPVAYIEPVGGVVVYMVETQEEIYLDFKNPDVALETLLQVFEKNA